MTNKSIQRQRRARRGRSKVRSLEINRLTVYRSNKHIYAQIMDSKGSEVLASASTNETEVKQQNNGIDQKTQEHQEQNKNKDKQHSGTPANIQ